MDNDLISGEHNRHYKNINNLNMLNPFQHFLNLYGSFASSTENTDDPSFKSFHKVPTKKLSLWNNKIDEMLLDFNLKSQTKNKKKVPTRAMT